MIKQIARYSDIMFAFPPKIRYFAEIESKNGTVFCAYENDEPVGVICLSKQVNAFDTAYIYVNEAYRRRGIARSLTEHAAAYAKDEETTLRFRVISGGKYASVCERIARSLHTQPCEEMTFFVLDVNTETKRVWEDYLPGAEKLLAKLESKTGRLQVVSFREASEMEDTPLYRLRDKIGAELPALDPFALPELDIDFSFLLLKNGEPVAFTAVRTIGRNMVYEISAAQYGTGTMMAIAPRFFGKLFDSHIERVVCMVYNNNQAGLTHVAKRFGFLFKERNRQTVYAIKD